MTIRIEDNFEDVLGKAARGLSMSASDLSDYSGIEESRVRSLMEGRFTREPLRRLASVLELDPDAMEALAEGRCYPEPVTVSGLAAFNEPFPVPGYSEMTVNSYLVWDESSGAAFAFDSGASGQHIVEGISERGLRLNAILLTHTHRDHVAGLGALKEAFGEVPVYVHRREAEAVPGAETIESGHQFQLGDLSVTTHLTHGHSPGGCSYLVGGLERPVAVVGDSIFCLSQGGAPADQFETARENNRRKLLGLPNETVLCPGHGPMTTVAFEKAHNPFFAKP